MLVGITVRGSSMWTIKLVNKREKILAAEQDVYQFAKSFDFSADPRNPKWTIPDNWKDAGISNSIRRATFEIQDQDEQSSATQVLVSEFGMNLQQSSLPDSIVANINRWRKEMNAEEIINYTLDEKGNPIERSAATLVVPFMKKIEVAGQTMYFDKIEGTHQKKSGSGAPFMDAMMGRGGHSDMAKAFSKPGNSGSPNDSSSNLPFEFTKPDDWKQIPGSQVSPLKFSVGDDEPPTSIAVSQFPASADSVNWQSTVSMWQGQLKLEKTEGEELTKITQQVPAGDLTGNMVYLVGQNEKKDTALLGVMIESGDKWFVKLQGSAKSVEAQKENFEAFVKSIQFKSDK